jgi:hypothetical protein
MATMMFAQRFGLCDNIRDRIIITTGIVIVIADIIHIIPGDIIPPKLSSPG